MCIVKNKVYIYMSLVLMLYSIARIQKVLSNFDTVFSFLFLVDERIQIPQHAGFAGVSMLAQH